MHALSTLMKVHSYCATNGELSEKARKLKAYKVTLEKRLTTAGGRRQVELEAERIWEKAVADGEVPPEVTKQVEAKRSHKESEPDIGTVTPPLLSPKLPTGLTRRRPRSVSAEPSPVGSKQGDLSETPEEQDLEEILDVLTWHPTGNISELACQMTDLRDALTSTEVNKVKFPNNITYFNFFDYLLLPTLVYELEYPRLDK